MWVRLEYCKSGHWRPTAGARFVSGGLRLFQFDEILSPPPLKPLFIPLAASPAIVVRPAGFLGILRGCSISSPLVPTHPRGMSLKSFRPRVWVNRFFSFCYFLITGKPVESREQSHQSENAIELMRASDKV